MIDLLHIPDLILKLHVFIYFFMRVISLTTGKMVPGLVTIMEMTTNLSILSHNLWIFKQCIKSEVNVVVNRQFICLYNINSLKQIMGEIYVNFIELCMEGDYFACFTGK
jgi:hypothetical protein